ncbi:hypothetical protein FQZ97_1094440 [compost metagenome]
MFTEFPAGSGISYTKGFLPKAFAGGFRLERCAEMFWDVMNSYASGPYVNNLPMAHVLMSVSDILIKLSAKDSEGIILSKAQIASSVELSSFKAFCKTGA